LGKIVFLLLKVYKCTVENCEDENRAIKAVSTNPNFLIGSVSILEIRLQLYKVICVQRKTGNKKIFRTGLTRSEAVRIVQSFPNYESKMYCFDKIFIDTDFTIYLND